MWWWEFPILVRRLAWWRPSRPAESGLRTIAVTNFPQSALAQSAEVVILTATNDPPCSATPALPGVAIAALDAIGVAVSVRKRESN